MLKKHYADLWKGIKMALLKVQAELKAPKSQLNKFGNYNYRSCEDILEALKPLLLKYEMTMTISDEMENIGERYYVKATITVKDGDNIYTVSAFAREEENKKGMDSMQLTGATSSYARKYALNGMFAIDDTKDSDATNTYDKQTPPQTPQPKPLTGYERLKLEKIELQKVLFTCKEDYIIWRKSIGEVDETSDQGMAIIVAELRKLKGGN